MRSIVTGDLTLEPLETRHADEMFEVLCDPAIYEYENAPPVSMQALHDRYQRLEARRSGDGRELWLNWVVRLVDKTQRGPLIGFVQATVFAGGHAFVAYEFGSRWWGRGLARRAVTAMIDELQGPYHVRSLAAVLKAANGRSLRLLQRLSFVPAPAATGLEPDEIAMQRELVCA